MKTNSDKSKRNPRQPVATKAVRAILTEHIQFTNRIQASALEVRGVVDKIKIYPTTKLEVTDLTRTADFRGVQYKTKSNREGKFLVLSKADTGDFKVECKLCGINFIHIKYIQFNPSKAHSFQHSIAIIFSLFGPACLIWPITRIDFACDFFMTFQDLIRCLNIIQKFSRQLYKNMKSITGFYVGLGTDELIVVYNPSSKKKKPSAEENPNANQEKRCRIEIRFTGATCREHIHSIEYILENPSKVVDLDILKHIELKIPFIKKSKFKALDWRSLHRLIEFTVINKLIGYFNSRKTMDINRNYKRDFSSLIEQSSFPVDFKSKFNADILSALQADPEESLW